MIYKFFCTAFVFLFLCGTSSFASSPYFICKYKYAGDSSLHTEGVGSLLESVRGDAIKICLNRYGKGNYYYVSSQIHKENGICYFSLTRYVKKKKLNKLYWVRNNYTVRRYQQHYMMLHEGKCPRQEHIQYIETNGISLGLFRVLASYYKKIKKDKRLLKEFVSHLRVENLEDDIIKGVYRLKEISLGAVGYNQALRYQLMIEKEQGKMLGMVLNVSGGHITVLSGMTIDY